MGVILIAGLTLTCAACRDKEPTPSLYVDLGDAGRPLPPPPKSAWLDPSLKTGRAEWQAFREPSLDGMTESGAASAAPRTDERAATGGVSAEVASRVESEIRQMVTDYNALAAEGRTEEMLDFYVSGQVDAARSMLESGKLLLAKVSELEQTLSTQLPDEHNRIQAVFDRANNANTTGVRIANITVENNVKAHANLTDMAGNPLPVQVDFVVEEDAWYMKYPPEAMSAAQAMATSSLPVFDQLKAGLESGQVPAEQILSSLEQAMATIGAAPGDASGGAIAVPAAPGAPAPPGESTGANAESPAPSPQLLKAGADAFTKAECFKCHGPDGKGGPRAPDLTDGEWVHCDGSIEGILAVLKSGVPQNKIVNRDYPFGMNPATNAIQDDDTLRALAAYVRSLSQ